MSRLWSHLAVQGSLCLFFFSRNQAALYSGYDGAYMRHLLHFHFEWAAWTTELIANPLQGLGNFTFPVNYWFSPASLLTYALSGDALSPVLIYTFTTLELFVSIWFLSSALGATKPVQISASWLCCVLVMPFIVPPYTGYLTFYPISGLVPWIVEHIALSNLILILIMRTRSANPRTGLIAAASMTGAILYSVIAFPYSALLAVPLAIAIFLFSSLTARPSFTRSRVGKMVWLGMGATLAVPMLFLVGLVIDSVPAFFHRELIYGRPTWVFISILFHGPQQIGWMSTFVFLAGLLGGVLAIRTPGSIMGFWARFYLAYSLVLVGLGVFLTFGITAYRGPSMLYFEWFVWPFMFIYGCQLLEWLQRLLGWYCGRIHYPQKVRAIRIPVAIPCGLLVPLLVVGLILIFNKPRAVTQVPWPPISTEITDYLRERVALAPGGAWRGSIATFNGIRAAGEGTGWPHNVSYDSLLWMAAGNDHRAMGLWWFSLPTLFSYNQFMPPDYYYLMTRLFATPRDAQQRSVVVLTKPDTRLLPLFGVRYVIAERELPPDGSLMPRQTLRWFRPCSMGANCQNSAEPHAQFLYELASPNLGNFSPTKQIIEPTAAGCISKMQASNFDPRRDVVLLEPVAGNLVRATKPSLHHDKRGLHVRAKSSAESLLVLPLQFSECLEITSYLADDTGGLPKLVRANVGLTGVWFSGRIDARIRLRTGPLSNVFCRINDYLQGRQMALGID